MKNKIILALLCVTLFCQSVTVFAENTEYDANENYTSSDELSNDSERTKIPIEGLDNCYILDDGSGFYVNIVNDKNEKLVETNFRSVESKLGEYDTIIVHYPEGMADSSLGLLSKDFKTIVPPNFYYNINFIKALFAKIFKWLCNNFALFIFNIYYVYNIKLHSKDTQTQSLLIRSKILLNSIISILSLLTFICSNPCFSYKIHKHSLIDTGE